MGPDWALLARAAAPSRRNRRIKPATGGFGGGSAPCVAGRPRQPRAGPPRRRLSGRAGNLHRRELCARQARGACVGKTKRGKGSKIMAIADRRGLPVAVHVESATPHEVTLVHATLAQRFVRQQPVRLTGDNAYESDSLDAALARQGVELLAWLDRLRHVRVSSSGTMLRTVVEEHRDPGSLTSWSNCTLNVSRR